MAKQRRAFTPEFKREAADLVLKQNYSYIEASRSLGIGESALRRWVDQIQKEHKGVTPQSKALTPEQQKIQELEARIARLEREKSILKNRLPGAPRPIGLETLRSTLILLDSGRWLFGGLVPVKKLDPGEAADPLVAARSVTPFRKVI